MSIPRQKPLKTFADYVVIGISPVLIMLLVGSLAFFLAHVFYRTQAIGTIRWVLFWFVLAIVLVSRIAIEKSSVHAAAYGAALALATCLFLAWMTPGVLVPVTILLAITWWCAHKLTFDCTLIDDTEDASGRGVLQDALSKPHAEQAPVPPVIGGKPPPIFRFPAEKPKGARTPGRWVVYFSLAALPLFGIGQLFLPGDEPGQRRTGFMLLLIYLGAALGLLVTTSFLGLRRYLRQRYLAMPGSIAVGWVRFGVVVILVTLGLAILLPRPGADYTWKTLTYQIDRQIHRASDYAFDWNMPGEGDGSPGNTFGGDATPRNDPQNNPPPQPRESQPSDTSQPNVTSSQSDSGNNNGGQTGRTDANSPPQRPSNPQNSREQATQTRAERTPEQIDRGTSNNRERTGGAGGGGAPPVKVQAADDTDRPEGIKGRDAPEDVQRQAPSQSRPTVAAQNPPTVEPASPPKTPPKNMALLLKILLWLVIAAVVVWFVIRNRALIVQLVRDFIAMLKRFFAGLARFRFKRKAPAIKQPDLPAREVPAFSTFSDPFQTGKDSIWPRERLIVYTYQALQAWSRDQRCPPRSEETPREFCLRLRRNFPEASTELGHLLVLYTHVAFAETLPANVELATLQRLWGFLTGTGTPVSMAATA